MAGSVRFGNPSLYTAAKKLSFDQSNSQLFSISGIKNAKPASISRFHCSIGSSGETGSASQWYNLSTHRITLIHPDTLFEEALRIIQREFDP